MGAGQKRHGDKASDRHNDHCHRCCHEETARPRKSTEETANLFYSHPLLPLCCLRSHFNKLKAPLSRHFTSLVPGSPVKVSSNCPCRKCCSASVVLPLKSALVLAQGKRPHPHVEFPSRASQTIFQLWEFLQSLLGKRAQEGLNQNRRRGTVHRQESAQTGGGGR